ncbi:hypothetical protein NKI98_14650 [Mesorhizobium sp. M0222]|uniref:hypothetical protein n=1 Tax=Mesorhizobium sp. M0222 TaxID=2956921 RepID=UPI00333A5387
MDRPMDAAANAALQAHRRRAAEQLVRDQVLAESFRGLPPATARQRLEASHYALMSSASPVAILWAQRP